MFCRCLAILIGLLVSSTSSCLRAQAIRQERQEEDKPLLPPNLMFAGEPSGGGNILIGFTIASLPSIPFSGTVEAENQIVDAKGNNTFQASLQRLPATPKDARASTSTSIRSELRATQKLVSAHLRCCYQSRPHSLPLAQICHAL
jgi:hypothetical protein